MRYFSPVNISIYNEALTKAGNAKFLGIVVDDKFKFYLYVSNLISNINRVTGMIGITKKYGF